LRLLEHIALELEEGTGDRVNDPARIGATQGQNEAITRQAGLLVKMWDRMSVPSNCSPGSTRLTASTSLGRCHQ
jgi:hypothetical protein